MIEYACANWCEVFSQMQVWIQGLAKLENRRGEIPKELKSAMSMADCLILLVKHDDILKDASLHTRLVNLRSELHQGCAFTPEVLIRELEGILGQVRYALQRRKFVFIAPENQAYFERDDLFGSDVTRAFGSASADIKAAGNCVAAELYTASVFHFMRASEFGLRSLANKLRVRLTDKKKPIAIEYATWGKIIDQCNNRIEESRQKYVGKPKAEKVQLYSEAAQHCTFMKDIFRNDVSHTGAPYNRADALQAFERVRDFMQFLARIL